MFYRFRPLNDDTLYTEIYSGKIYLANSSKFNDRIDCLPKMYFQASRELWKAFLISYIYALFEAVVYLESTDKCDLKHLKHDFCHLNFTHSLSLTDYERVPIHDYSRTLANQEYIIKFTELLEDKIINTCMLTCFLKILQNVILSDVSELITLQRVKTHLTNSITKEQILNYISAFSNGWDSYNNQFHEGNHISEIFDSQIKGLENKISTNFEKVSTNVYGQDISLQIKIVKFLNSFAENFIKNSIKHTIPHSRIACFTKNKTSLPMWTHYASSYKGFCIGYDESILREKTTEHRRGRDCITICKCEVNQVQYVSNNQSFNFFEMLVTATERGPVNLWFKELRRPHKLLDYYHQENGGNFITNYRNFVKYTFTTKYSDWAYENEFRLILNGDMSDIPECIDVSDCIREIIFGIETPYDTKQKIVKTINRIYANCDTKPKILQSYINLDGKMSFYDYQ